MSRGLAGALVRVAGWIVPRDRRCEWQEEWRSEMHALQQARAAGADGCPTPLEFALGAVPHAISLRVEDWTVEGVLQDVRFALRVLRRAPAFTLVAAVTLALGIGANGAIFSLVNGLVLRQPPGIHQPERLVQVARSYESAPRWDNFSWPAMRLIRAESRELSGVAGFQSRGVVIGSGTDTERAVAQYVTGNFFELLGVRPRLGRLIQPQDEVRPGAHTVVVLSHALWESRFGADPGVVGRTLPIGAIPYEIVGVAPASFRGAATFGSAPDLYLSAMQVDPASAGDRHEAWGSSWINLVGRLEEGASLQSATADMEIVSTRLREASPENADMQVLLAAGVGLDPTERTEAEAISWILLVIVGVVLLLACTNVANLSLTRASARRTEIGVRVALGAGRWRVARQLVTESLLLAGLSTVLAIPVVMLAGSFLPAMLPYPIATPLAADATVYLALGAIGLLAGLLCGLAPAWTVSSRAASASFRDRSATGGPGGKRLRDGLVVVQLALSLGLVAGAVLLGRSVQNAHLALPGFDPSNVVATSIDLGGTGRYDLAQAAEFFQRLSDRARSTPGVRAAAVASQMPIAGGHARRTVYPLGGTDEQGFEAEYTVVGDGYFDALRIPILEGRALGGLRDEPEPVVVVNERLADIFWPGESAIGKQLEGDPPLRVVGVAADVQMRSIRSAANPGVYYPMAHEPSGYMALHLAFEPGRVSPTAAAGIVAELDPSLPVSAPFDLPSAITDSMGETKAIGILLTAFALLALSLAVVGLYGLIAHGASQRVREMGIRIALGADPDSLVRLILVRGVVLAGVGLVLGLGVSFGLGRAMETLLFQVSPSDLGALGPAVGLLLLAAVIAAWIPARRASRVDAAVSLRES